MFTPEYIAELVEKTNESAAEFNMYITNKVIDAIVKQFEFNGEILISPSNQHRIDLLKQSGILASDIEKEIEKRLPGMEKAIKNTFLQAGYDINDDINKAVSDMVDNDTDMKDFIGDAPRLENLTDKEKKILDVAYKRTNHEIKNLTKTTAGDMNENFINSCDKAWWKATHGVDPATAIREAIDEASKYGANVIYVNKKTGTKRKMSVESAVRMCVLTGINQANAEITLQTCADMGCKNVLVSSHLGARYTQMDEPANHMSWQGKVYSLSDDLLQKYGYVEKEPENEPSKNIFWRIKEFFQKFRKEEEYEDFETVTGYGTIEGFAGVNCRHTMQMFFKGMKNNQTQYDSEENKKAYDTSQKQRAIERKIRDTKKRLFEIKRRCKIEKNDALREELEDQVRALEELLDKQNEEYTEFCEENGLQRREERLYVSNK